MYKNKKSGLLGIIITVIILILLVLLTNVDNENLHFFENFTSNIISPIQNGFIYLKNKISGNSTFFASIDTLKAENEELKKQNAELEENLRELEIVKNENATLKDYLNISKKYTEYKTIPGYVISRDISNYSKTLVINIGTEDGIQENMVVIAADGLVGYITSATNNTSKVQTIVDTSSGTSCVMSSTRDSIVCKGTLKETSMLNAMYIPIEASIIEGDSIETSGLGGIYPKGIYVGKVKQVVNTKNIADRYIKVETGVNFEKLENVLVITANNE